MTPGAPLHDDHQHHEDARDDREGGQRDDARALATAFVEALRPVAARMTAERTLSSGKVNILRHLAAYERATSADLSGATEISPQAVSLAVKEMETLGFVERHPDPDDRRRAWLVLTETGRRRLDDELEVSARWLTEAITLRLSPADAEALAHVVPVLHRLDETAAAGG